MLKPPVKPTAETEAFWKGCDRGELTFQCCGNCGKPQFPPSVSCVHCHSDRLEWRASAGRGTVHSFTVVERAPLPSFRSAVPYIIALIDLEEGFRMMMNIRTPAPDTVHVGMPVDVVFEPYDDVQLPQAVPATAP